MIVSSTHGYPIEQIQQFVRLFSPTIVPLPHEYGSSFHYIENLPLQHNQTHPFMNFTHKHPHNSILGPTTLFIYVHICPNFISTIVSLLDKFLLRFWHISSLCLPLPYSKLCPSTIGDRFDHEGIWDQQKHHQIWIKDHQQNLHQKVLHL